MSSTNTSVALPSIITTGLLVITAIFPILATVFVILRLQTRLRTVKKIGIDDWVIVAALIVTWGMSINVWIGGAILGVNTSKIANPIEAASLTIRTSWIDTWLLTTTLVLIKISILFFYKTIFVKPKFAVVCNIGVGVMFCWWLSNIFVTLFLATPITDAWNVTVNHFNVDDDAFFVAFAAMSLFFDVAILTLPAPIIIRLQMSTRRKLLVTGIFWLGAFCCIAAAIRLYYLNQEIYHESSGDGDSSFSVITTTFLWAKVECACSIIAACLPTLAPMVGEKRRYSAATVNPYRQQLHDRVNGPIVNNQESLSGNSGDQVELRSHSWGAHARGYTDLDGGESTAAPQVTKTMT